MAKPFSINPKKMGGGVPPKPVTVRMPAPSSASVVAGHSGSTVGPVQRPVKGIRRTVRGLAG